VVTKVVNYAQQIGFFISPQQWHDGKWLTPTLKSLKEYPCMMMIPRRKASDVKSGVRQERIDKSSETECLFREMRESFKKARAHDFTSEPEWLREIRRRKMQALEYEDFRVEIPRYLGWLMYS
jgi:hypothetical protein